MRCPLEQMATDAAREAMCMDNCVRWWNAPSQEKPPRGKPNYWSKHVNGALVGLRGNEFPEDILVALVGADAARGIINNGPIEPL
jgi:hypothetical protein